jgi:hypothetical protein
VSFEKTLGGLTLMQLFTHLKNKPPKCLQIRESQAQVN